MTIKFDLQHNLSFVFSKPDISLEEKTKTELIEELAKLIFQLWEIENIKCKTEENINER